MRPKGLILTQTHQDARPPSQGHAGHLTLVGNKPILFHTLESMAAAGIREVAIAVTAEAEPAVAATVGSGERWGIRVSFVRAERSDDVPGILLASEAFLDGHAFVLHDGNGLLRHDLGALLRSVGDEPLDVLVLVHGGATDSTGCRRDGATLLALAGGFRPRPGFAPAGAQVFGGGFMAGARDELSRHHAGSDLAGLAQGLSRRGTRVGVRRIQEWRRYAGRPRELLEMNRLVLDRLDPGPAGARAHAHRSEIEGRVVVHPTASVSSSLIRGPAVIGAGATVIDAFIGPHTSIGDGSRIEGSEIEHSIVFPGAAVLHVAARVESSVLGRDARVVRDFAVPQTMRLELGDRAYVRLR